MPRPFRLVSIEEKPDRTVVRAGSCIFGGVGVPVIAGPCAVEDEDLYLATAEVLAGLGVSMLRGGVFKPRT